MSRRRPCWKIGDLCRVGVERFPHGLMIWPGEGARLVAGALKFRGRLPYPPLMGVLAVETLSMDGNDLRIETLEASIASTFELLAWEMELAGARCILLDSVIGGLMDQAAPEKQAALTEGLHTVDLLSQHLTGLSAFARKMGAATSPEMMAPVHEALADITLGALADRMSSALGGLERGINDGDDAGDLDLF
jgi:hypothetical protein